MAKRTATIIIEPHLLVREALEIIDKELSLSRRLQRRIHRGHR